nr:MAG TPA: hypothetical protein [Caudoviricetes sp.]
MLSSGRLYVPPSIPLLILYASHDSLSMFQSYL